MSYLFEMLPELNQALLDEDIKYVEDSKYSSKSVGAWLFTQACYCGKLEYAQKVYENEFVRSGLNMDHIFIQSVVRKQYEVVKWLLETDPFINISTCGNYITKYCIKNSMDNFIELFQTYEKKSDL